MERNFLAISIHLIMKITILSIIDQNFKEFGKEKINYT